MLGISLGQYMHDTSYDYAIENNLLTKEKLLDYLKRVSSSYVTSTQPRQFLQQYSLFHQVKGSDSVVVDIQSFNTWTSIKTDLSETININLSNSYDEPTNSMAWITITAANVMPDDLLKLSSMILTARNLDINRALLDIVSDPDTLVPGVSHSGYVSMIRLLVNPDPAVHSTSFISQNDFKNQLKADLKRLKWLDDATLNLGLIKYPQLGLEKAEIITAICSMLHGPLSKINSQSYASLSSILHIFDSSPHYILLADNIAQLFLQRFKPVPTSDGKSCRSSLSDEEFQKSYNDLNVKIGRLHHEAARNLLLKMLETVANTLRTNFYNENRYALSFRIHPSIMINSNNTTTTNIAAPFGVFFSHGRYFNGFHCRFRDIARG